ncbi:MAG: glycosyltransferase family 2 protein [Bacillota bacterium]
MDSLSKIFAKSLNYHKQYGILALFKAMKDVGQAIINQQRKYYKKHVFIAKEIIKKQQTYRFSYEPKISIITPTYNTPITFLEDMVESVLNQTYNNWELCIADASVENEPIRRKLNEWVNNDSRIKVKFLSKNYGISGNSNEALALATGEFVGLLDHDDTLAPIAVFEMVKAINQYDDVDFLYSDRDKTNETGSKYKGHHFKPDWAPDMMRSYNYVCHFTVFRRSLLQETGLFNPEYDGSQDYDLFLRLTEKSRRIVHVTKILYHWRMHENSTARSIHNKMYAIDAAKNALADHLKRSGLEGSVENGFGLAIYNIRYKLKSSPKVSIIIPNKDQYQTLRTCIESILTKTTYTNYEIIIVENNTSEKDVLEYYKMLEKDNRIKILYWTGGKEFNYSALNNFAVQHAYGKHIVFLNNDTVVITPHWLERMLEFSQREDVGCVGVALYYPNNTYQHAGVIIGIDGCAAHAFHKMSNKKCGYFLRAKIVQNLSAVTGACMMLKKKDFLQVEGFDETLAVTYNDIDLCMKIRNTGKLIVYVPDAELHHMCKNGGLVGDTAEKKARFEKELSYFRSKWGKIKDPYFNENLKNIYYVIK